MDSKKIANTIIINVASRDRTDSYVPPGMVAVVILAYIVVMLRYYAITIQSFSGALTSLQMFNIMAVYVIGMALVLSVFYLLMSRNTKHIRRERKLRALLREYAKSRGADVKRLAQIDSEIRSKEKEGLYIAKMGALVFPAALGTLALFFLDLQTYGVMIILACWSLSMLAILAVAPPLTTTPRAHEKRTLPFYEEFNRISPGIGIEPTVFERVIGVRSFMLSIFIAAITLGLYLPVWAFQTFNDMNRHFMEQWYFEDCLIKSLRKTFA